MSESFAILSKLSCLKKGYKCVGNEEPLKELCNLCLNPAFQNAFTSPEMNIGTFLRSRFIRSAIKEALMLFGDKNLQIINFGAGFDSLFFNSEIQNDPRVSKYFEIDLPDVLKHKNKALMSNSLKSFYTNSTSIEKYKLVPVNLKQFDFTQFLKDHQFDNDEPVILIFELVLLYLDAKTQQNILAQFNKWSLDNNVPVIAITVEPNNIENLIGKNLVNFVSTHLDDSLAGKEFCQNNSSQIRRFSTSGWHYVFLESMWYAFENLERSTGVSLCKREMLDEHFLMRDLFSNYSFIVASTLAGFDLKRFFESIIKDIK